MKTEKALLGMAMALMLMVQASDVSAQRQRDGRNDNRGGNSGRDQRGPDRKDDRRDDRDKHDHQYSSRRSDYHYDNHHRHGGRPVVVHHYQAPRYVYYRDYNMYYDCHRSTYIVLSGRRWVVVSQRPDVVRRVDLNYAYHTDVDYYDDDLPRYLGR